MNKDGGITSQCSDQPPTRRWTTAEGEVAATCRPVRARRVNPAKTGCYVTLSDVKEEGSHERLTGFVHQLPTRTPSGSRPQGRVSIARCGSKRSRHRTLSRASSSRDRNPGVVSVRSERHVRAARTSLRALRASRSISRRARFLGLVRGSVRARGCSAWSSRPPRGRPRPTVTGRGVWPASTWSPSQPEEPAGPPPRPSGCCVRSDDLVNPTMRVGRQVAEAAGLATKPSVSSAPSACPTPPGACRRSRTSSRVGCASAYDRNGDRGDPGW